MICRDATADDVRWLAGVAAESYRLIFAPMLPACDLTPFDDAHFRARLGEVWPRARIVAEEEALGFALMTAGHVDMVFVDANARGRGAGSVLMDDAEARGAVSLESFALNGAARRFYEARGWRLAGGYTRAFAGAECAFVRYERP